ncbi:MAG TPA: cytochrome c [Roseiarcus sp.]|nr:cytochrome c [Roseiarcus sp.]
MKRTLFVTAMVMFGATAVLAQSDAIAQRRALMKENGKAAQAIAAMLKGAPFDLATVQASLKTFVNAAQKAPALFPDDSKTGGDTHALPAIWENKADFNAHFAKLGDDATAALATIKDAASLKATMANFFDDCGSCHQTYRAKLN